MRELAADQLRAEVVFWRGRHATGRQRDTVGVSSNALLELAIRLDLGAPVGSEPRAWPSDVGDLARCERTYLDAPEHLQKLMRPTLAAYRRRVATRLIQSANALDGEGEQA